MVVLGYLPKLKRGHKLLRFIFNHPLKQWLSGTKRVERNKKNEYLANEKSSLDEIKTFFMAFKGRSFSEN